MACATTGSRSEPRTTSTASDRCLQRASGFDSAARRTKCRCLTDPTKFEPDHLRNTVETLKPNSRSPLLRHAYAPRQIAGGFAQDGDQALALAVGLGVGTRGHVDGTDAFVLQQFADTKHVIGVADGDAAVQSVGTHDYGDAHG